MTPKAAVGRWQERFLIALRKSPNISRACKAAEISRKTAYQEKEVNPEFAEGWEDALEASLDALEEAAHRRAIKRSDTLTIFLLKAHRKEKYAEAVPVQHSGEVRIRVEYDDSDPATDDPAA